MCTSHGGPLQQLQTAVQALADADPHDAADESLRSSLPLLLTALHQLSAVVAGVVGVFDGRDLAQLDACRTAKAWLVAFGRMSPHAASGWVNRSRLLGGLPALQAAARSGAVSVEHVRKVEDLASRVGPAAVAPFD